MNEHQVRREFEAFLDKACKDEVHSEQDPRRIFFLRPSGFPRCVLRWALEFHQKYDKPVSASFDAEYYLQVGHAIHHLYQHHLPRRKKIVGDYYCKGCSTLYPLSTEHVCPVCGRTMKYEELEVKYRKTILGHVDTLYRFNLSLGVKSPHAVWDYKSTSTAAILEYRKTKKNLPYVENKAQLLSYVPMLELQYGIKITHATLVYQSRESSRIRQLVMVPFTQADKQKQLDWLKKLVKGHRLALTARTVGDLKELKRYKLCKSAEDYRKNHMNNWSVCPYVDKCFTSDMNKEIRRTHEKNKWPIIKLAPADIRQELEL